MVGNHVADGFAGAVTNNSDNFAGVETAVSHRVVKQEVRRSLRERRRNSLVAQAHESPTLWSVLQTADLRPSKAFDAPITRGQEIEVFLAQLDLTTTTCSGDFTICGWCGKGVGTTQHWFGECGAWAGDRRELGVRGTADFFRNPATAHD